MNKKFLLVLIGGRSVVELGIVQAERNPGATKYKKRD